jgi:flagellar hook-associated protein 1 FlgK
MSFNVGVTALRTSQAALQVIGHNIANVNTSGFSRQNVSLEQIPGQKFGNGFFGKGVEIASIDRSYNQFLTREANLTAASAAAASERYQRMQKLEQLFPMGEAGLGRQLNGFLNAWADVVASPTNQTARGVVLTRADEFARRINQTASQLDELRSTTRVQIESSISAANRLSSSIASINQRIVDAFASGRAPNDLLDQRDRLIAELNQIVEVRTLDADDRSITVFAANSVPLVLGNRSTDLVGSESVSVQGRYTLGFGSETVVINEELLAGGSLKGLLSFYNDDVADVRNQLGRLALSTVELINRQHQAGLDLNGHPGLNVFNPISLNNTVQSLTPGVSSSHLSLAVIPVGVDSEAPTQFQASDYSVELTPSGVVIRRLSDDRFLEAQPGGGLDFTASTPATVAFTGGPPGGTIDFDGLRLTDNGTSAGESFVLKPFSRIADQVQLALTSPSQLAVASPLVIQAGPSNQGTLEVESIVRLPFGAPASATPQSDVTLSFDASGGFTLTATAPPVAPGAIQVRRGGELLTPPGGPFEFVSGAELVLELPGQAPISLNLRGAPGANDTFVIRPANPNAQLPPPDPLRPVFDVRSNAGNGRALLAMRDLDALDGYTLSDGYIPVFAAVSSSIQIAQADSEFATRVADQAEAARANQAGVNLDEEAARLLQFQQSYQASARYLQSMQAIFDTLLSTFR